MRRRSIHVISSVAFTLLVTAAVTPIHAQGIPARCAAPAPDADLLSLDLESLMDRTGCGAQCGLCRPYLRRMLQTGETEFSEIITD